MMILEFLFWLVVMVAVLAMFVIMSLTAPGHIYLHSKPPQEIKRPTEKTDDRH